MRDPYHNARQRFKVARDRLIEQQLVKEGNTTYREEFLRSLKQTLTLGFVEPEWSRNDRTNRNPLFDEFLEAKDILVVMMQWGIKDEKQAHMVYKLTRS